MKGLIKMNTVTIKNLSLLLQSLVISGFVFSCGKKPSAKSTTSSVVTTVNAESVLNTPSNSNTSPSTTEVQNSAERTVRIHKIATTSSNTESETFKLTVNTADKNNPDTFNQLSKNRNLLDANLFTATPQTSSGTSTTATAVDNEEGTQLKIRNFNEINSTFLQENKWAILNGEKINRLEIKSKLLNNNDQSQACFINSSAQIDAVKTYYLRDVNSVIFDQENDIYQTQLLYKVKGENTYFSIICQHTTSDFYLQQVVNDFYPMLIFYTGSNTEFPKADVIKSHTLDLILKSFKITNVNEFKKAIFSPLDGDGLFFVNGALQLSDDKGQKFDTTADLTSNYIAAGLIQMGCTIRGYTGELTADKIFVLVERGLFSSDVGGNMAQTYHVYRADENTRIEINCIIQKTASVDEFNNVFKGILEFGVLNRKTIEPKLSKMITIEEGKQKADNSQD